MALSFLLPASSTAVTSSKLRISNPRKSNTSRTHQWRTSIIVCSTRTDEATLAKNDLLELISDEERGVKTHGDPSKQSKIIKAIDAMEVLGKGSVTTAPSLSATWRMLWTTEKEQLFIIKNAHIFGTQTGDVLQVIDVERGILNNVITFPPSGVFFVRSNIEVASPQRVNFRFESIYLDDEIRVAKDIRGDYLVVDRSPYSWRE
ncbi:probable plastid-lipid-associated protein 11, chloroplastic isoform X2 [Telopea speciosissima]|uniref:probable plastid-lipid-associated protein 11, chloroplastic isoform X2 n=1 Tax=Telopea speciosissima TaxID=54955 RepID=UPI001CC66BE7|nr:probable plastid-lipid-associated protein 11, chloroplastic isoform X2 [Telopea speciosissima]